ncbi:hypothetical protein PVAG01_01380 [Phlyctema vagabunda]|uniref:RING-CH-type domain-containing protein n=1 Tax=Phlyctema vagabunda TaxID=108571 RepID=A0ABR4PXA7_9HELO
MASQSPQASRRRSQREDHPSASSASHPPESMEESEYFMLNHSQITTPSAQAAGQAPEAQETAPSVPTLAPAPIVPPQEGDEPRECWICREDDTDEGPEQSSEWRSPCPCSMQAHEACLLQWITDIETQRSADVLPSQIVCPVCKSPYQIERPRDYIVVATDTVRNFARSMIFPTAVSTVLGTTYSGFMIYGINSLHLVFGLEHARYIMSPSSRDLMVRNSMSQNPVSLLVHGAMKIMDPFFPNTDSVANWKLFVGLPLIAPALVLSRIRLADPIFAFLPVIYFVMRAEQQTFRDWPPSPSLTFAVLPYVRSTYNYLYRLVFSQHIARWDKAIQRTPREGETPEQIQAANRAALAEEDAILDIQVELLEDADDENEEDLGHNGQDELPQRQQNQEELHQPDGPIQPPRNRNQNNWEVQQNMSVPMIEVGAKVMGALFFPAISSLMGDLLKLALPKAWVFRAARRPWRSSSSSGLLHEKWGRSVVGGCLFVVLKDAIILYCKWRKAKDAGKRKILNYVKN